MVKNKTITFVMTSCNRFDLLEPTLKSFIESNTYSIEKYIFIEDTEKIIQLKQVVKKFPEVYNKALLLYNLPKLGQIKSIDRAYSYVDTDYIFHCEEDWEFYKTGFIEDSIEILEEDSKILNVWLRELTDTNGHPVEKEEFTSKNGLKYKKLCVNYLGKWHGFTFNPTVKRVSDYKKLGAYQSVGHESEIGQFYFEQGFKAVVFTEGFVKHSGWHRRVLDNDKKRSKLQIEVDSWIKKQKAKMYKTLGIFGKKHQS